MIANKGSRVVKNGALTAAVIGLVAAGCLQPASAKGGHAGGGAHAGGSFAHNHPRRAQVLHRDAGLKQHMNADYGHLGGHYGQLQHEANGIHRQERQDAMANGGHITHQEQHQLNHEEAGLQHQMNRDYSNAAPKGTFAHNHPRRSQVLRDDNHMGNELSHDKGQLGGNYNQLEQKDSSIRHQEQADAKANGGYIKPGQEQQLFSEERNLQKQINHDNK